MKLEALHARLSKRAKYVKAVAKKITEPSNKRPVFVHKEIHELYKYGVNIPHSIIETILDLPRTTLIEDLHKVLYDSAARFEYFQTNNNDKDFENKSFTHAIILLTELKSEESLPIIFDLMRQGNNFYDEYLCLILEEYLWDCFYVLGQKNPDDLFQFLFEPNRYCIARNTVLRSLVSIAVLHPEKANKVIAYLETLIDAYIERYNDNTFIDTGVISAILCAIDTVNAGYLLPKVKQLYDLDLVNDAVNGTYDEYCNNFHKSEDDEFILYPTVYEKYDALVDEYAGIFKDDDDDCDEDYDDDDYEEDILHHDFTKSHQTQATQAPKPAANRNDPCPCGSGQKYKKCCGKNI